jgi:hypothetical protein
VLRLRIDGVAPASSYLSPVSSLLINISISPKVLVRRKMKGPLGTLRAPHGSIKGPGHSLISTGLINSHSETGNLLQRFFFFLREGIGLKVYLNA